MMQAVESSGRSRRPTVGRTLTVLGLESSCDETAAAVVRLLAEGGAEVLSDEIARQDAEHAPYGGVVPEIAARAHASKLDGVAARAMAKAGVGFADLDGVAATAGPGLVGGVMVALMTGKAIALAHDLPLLAVNHLEGHALSPRLSEPVEFPYLLLLVSGGHTQLLVVEDVGRYRRLASTIDDAAGEAFDKLAKAMGLGHPGGPAVERLAAKGDAKRFDLPRPLLGSASPDFSFAGLKTAARRAWDSLPAPTDKDRADLAASFQAAVAAVIADRTRRALATAQTSRPLSLVERGPGGVGPGSKSGRAPNESSASRRDPPRGDAPHPLPPLHQGEGERITALVAAGGVAANSAIRAALARIAQDAGVPLIAPPLKWCTDNAAMIALAGAERLARGERDPLDVGARPRWPLDPDAAAAAPAVGGGGKGPKA